MLIMLIGDQCLMRSKKAFTITMSRALSLCRAAAQHSSHRLHFHLNSFQSFAALPSSSLWCLSATLAAKTLAAALMPAGGISINLRINIQ